MKRIGWILMQVLLFKAPNTGDIGSAIGGTKSGAIGGTDDGTIAHITDRQKKFRYIVDAQCQVLCAKNLTLKY